ncbi:MAG: tetratricopeptide repeat protein [Planctomycetes bacterium]|nr:tetratricopeptide repeat protein [Planctomycetota bacterium]
MRIVPAEAVLNDITNLFRELVREPLFVLGVFALVGLFALWRILRALRGVADRMGRRRALREFVTGVDLMFKGEFAEARAALEKVIERDPENGEARVLLGDACRELGDPAEAHKHHYQVDRVFSLDLPRNHLSLGRDLLVLGRPEEALSHLEKAAAAYPDDRGTAGLLLDARLAAGRLPEAVNLARRLADEDGGRAARRRLSRVLALAAREQLDQGHGREAVPLLTAALEANPALVGPRVDLVRAAWITGGERSAGKSLAEQIDRMVRLAEIAGTSFEPPGGLRPLSRPRPGLMPGESETGPPRIATAPVRPALPGPPAEEARLPTGRSSTEASPPAVADLPLPAAAETVGHLLAREAGHLCERCGFAAGGYSETCPDCGAFGSLAEIDRNALRPLGEVRAVFEEVSETRAFVRSLVRRAADGDPAAADRLRDMGKKVVPSIFRELPRVDDGSVLERILADLGPEAMPVILDAWRRSGAFSATRLVHEGVSAFRSLDGVLVRVLSRMGSAALPGVLRILESGDRELRSVALDVLVRLGAAGRLEEMRLDLSTQEVIARLNACPEDDLAPFLDAVPDEGFLAETVLTDRTFARERALVAALARPGNGRKIRRILMARGFSGTVYEGLEVLWDREGLRSMVSDVVRSFGAAAGDHLIKTCITAGLPEGVRDEALRLLTDLSGDEIDRAVERLSEGDPDTERAAERMVQAFGGRAIAAILRAYEKTGLLEKVGLNRRRLAHRRVMFIHALGRIGGHEAAQALRRILAREADADLRRRIEGTLSRVEKGGGP